VASHAATAHVALAVEDAGLLGWILTGAGMDVAVAARVPVQTGTDPAEGIVAHVFTPASPDVMAARSGDFGPCLDLTADEPDTDLADDVDRAAVEAAAHLPGAAALWRAWRAPSDGSPWPPPRRVFLLALNGQTEPFEAAAALQQDLAAHGEIDPQVEAFVLDEHLPAYHRSARARSALLWTTVRPDPIRLAPVYDGVTADGTPLFDLDRPRLTAPDREPVAAALDSGSVLMSTTTRLDDVLDPADGRAQVPAGFRTDGSWVWSDAVAYYLRTHGVAPVADLLSHLDRRRTDPPAQPDAVALFRATAALTRPPDRSH
jgi:hypothetical protein